MIEKPLHTAISLQFSQCYVSKFICVTNDTKKNIFCKWSISLYFYLQDNISAKLDSICGSMGMLKAICKKLVNKYKEKLIDELVNDEDAKDACKKLKLCK